MASQGSSYCLGSQDSRHRQRDRHGRIMEPLQVEYGSKLRLNFDPTLLEKDANNGPDHGDFPELPCTSSSVRINGAAVAGVGSKKSKRPESPPDEFGTCYDDERIKQNSVIIKDLEMKDNRLTVATATVGHSLIGFSVCSNCNHIARPPVSCCSEGHIVCGYCVYQEQIDMCPRLVPALDRPGPGPMEVQCGARISACPLDLYKHYFNTNVFFCPYTDKGCTETYPGSALDTHINNCEFRPSVVCPFSVCDLGMIEPRDFFAHLAEHGVPTFRTNATPVKVKHARRAVLPYLRRDFRWVAAHFHAGKLDFLLLVQESKNELYLWIQLYSKAHLLNKRMFISRITMNIPGSSRELEWCGDVLRSEANMDLISKPDCCMVVLKGPFERHFMYRGEDDHSYFNVEILIDQVVLNRLFDESTESSNSKPRLSPSYRLELDSPEQ